MPNFVAIRNGDDQHLDLVQQGNEHVLGARFADADFFVREDLKRPLESYRPGTGGVDLPHQAGLDAGQDRAYSEAGRTTLIPMLGLDKRRPAIARDEQRNCARLTWSPTWSRR